MVPSVILQWEEHRSGSQGTLAPARTLPLTGSVILDRWLNLSLAPDIGIIKIPIPMEWWREMNEWVYVEC